MELLVDIEKKLKNLTLKVNFSCHKGTLGILGESGSGKSMTLKCLAGLATPEKGRIILNGRTLFDSEKKINVPIRERKIGMLFQNYALFPHMTVEKNISYGLSKLSKPERASALSELLKMMHIEDIRNSYPSEISGGQMQRVALARALAVKPEALFLDEPFSALDNYLKTVMQGQMKEILQSYNGVSLFVTHNIEEAYSLCNNIMILSRGSKAAFGESKALFDKPPTVEVARLTGCENISALKPSSSFEAAALDWSCHILSSKPLDNKHKYIGIRASSIKQASVETENVYAASIAFTTETPSSQRIYVRLDNSSSREYDLVWEMPKDQWKKIKPLPENLKIHLPEESLFYMF